jgi:hypothetical protein
MATHSLKTNIEKIVRANSSVPSTCGTLVAGSA